MVETRHKHLRLLKADVEEHISRRDTCGLLHLEHWAKSGLSGCLAARLREVRPEKAARGIPVEDFIAQIESGSRARVAEAVYNSLTNGVFYDQEYRIQLTSGGFRWLRTTGRVILDSDRLPIMAMGTVRDISAGKLLLM